ncbi:MAG: hypothetical protein ACLVC1_01990 [Mediterraneibacter gnavus]
MIKIPGHSFFSEANQRIIFSSASVSSWLPSAAKVLPPTKNFTEGPQMQFLPKEVSTLVGVDTTAKSTSPFLTERMACGVEWLYIFKLNTGMLHVKGLQYIQQVDIQCGFAGSD